MNESYYDVRSSPTGHRIWKAVLLIATFGAVRAPCVATDLSPKNLALSALGAKAHSWEPGVVVIPEHEAFRVNDGSVHSYWVVRAIDLPADIRVEWPNEQRISSVVVRYFDGRMVHGPVMARTQEWARLQYWDQTGWSDIQAQVVGQETSSVRYSFAPLNTTRVRLLFSEPPDPEARSLPERLGIYVCELEAYADVPFQVVNPPARLVKVRGGHGSGPFYNEWSSDNPYDRAGPLVIEPKPTRIITDTLRPTLIVAESRRAKAPCVVDRPRKGEILLKNGFLQLEVSIGNGFKETLLRNLVSNESVATGTSSPFLIRTPNGELSSANFKVVREETSGSDPEISQLRVDLTSQTLDLSIHY